MKLFRLFTLFAAALSLMGCSISVSSISSKPISSSETSSVAETTEESTLETEGTTEETTGELTSETTEETTVEETSEFTETTTSDATSESTEETTEEEEPELELLSFGLPFEDSPSARHLGPRMPHRHSRQTGQTIYLSETENVPLVAQVKNNNRLIFMDIVVWSEALGTDCVFNEGHGKYQCSSTTEYRGGQWVTDIVLDVNYSLINLDTENCEDSKKVEISEITFLSVTEKRSHPKLTDSSAANVTFRFDNEVSPVGHNWNEWATITEPTCAAEGLERRICKNNPEHIEERSIDKLPHEYGDDQYCDNCGAPYAWEYLAYKYVSAYDGYEVTGSAPGVDRSSLKEVIIPDTYNGKKVLIIGKNALTRLNDMISLDFGKSVIVILENSISCPNMTSCVLPDGLQSSDAFFGMHESAYNVYENARYVGSPNNPYLYWDGFIDTEATEIVFARECRFATRLVFNDFLFMKHLDQATKISMPDAPRFGLYNFDKAADIPETCYSVYKGGKYLGNEGNPYVLLYDSVDTITEIAETCKSIFNAGVTGDGGEYALPESVEYINSFGCSNVSSLVFPDTLWTHPYRFQCMPNIESVTLPYGVVTLSENWAQNTVIKECSLPKTLLSIEEGAFSYCRVLKTIKYAGTMSEWNEIKKHDQWYLTSKIPDEDGEYAMISTVICSDGVITNPSPITTN